MHQQVSTYGLIGYPLDYSLSPVMHNAAFRALNVEATYKTFPLKKDQIDTFFKDLKKQDSPIFGLNVTVPYKQEIISHLDCLQPYAQKVKAVNTISIDKKRKLTGFNTDGPGFLTHLTELGFDPNQKRIALLGAGGAARAIVSSLCMIPQRPQWIKIFDVKSSSTENLILDLGQNMNLDIVENVHSIDDANIELADLLINATPVGLRQTDLALVEPELLHADMLVYDLIYNPQETKLLNMARLKGAKVSNGLGMLFYQGVLAFQHWAEMELSGFVKEQMHRALLQALKGV